MKPKRATKLVKLGRPAAYGASRGSSASILRSIPKKQRNHCTGSFAAGQMNFYLAAVDDQMRHAGDQPTIGLLLCRDHKRLTVEYALRNCATPIGVAKWRTKLVDSLPKKLRGLLPSVEELERKLR